VVTPPGLGAPSLLARNDDQVWPEFKGQDLATRCRDLAFRNLAADGATTADVIARQLGAVKTVADEPATLVTLTAGGNDLLGLVGAPEGEGAAGVVRVLAALGAILSGIRAALPRAILIVGNVYDPTDGTGDLDGARLRAQEMRWLAEFNDGVARLCDAHGARLADIHGRFQGHGRAAPAAERWYWTRWAIEPGHVGAHEIRRLWLELLG
jgi:lysophospholipase L1-like esterase